MRDNEQQADNELRGWQVIATANVRRLFHADERVESVLYDGVSYAEARALAEMLNRQERGVSYHVQVAPLQAPVRAAGEDAQP